MHDQLDKAESKIMDLELSVQGKDENNRSVLRLRWKGRQTQYSLSKKRSTKLSSIPGVTVRLYGILVVKSEREDTDSVDSGA